MMNGTTKKLKNAPHLSEQDKAPYSEIIALIGDKAWNAWGTGENKGKNLEWDLLIRVLANTSSNEQEYFFIYPKTFREITKDYPKTMVFNVLSNAGILVEPRKHEKGYEYQVKIPKSIDGRSARAYKIIPVLENESESLDS